MITINRGNPALRFLSKVSDVKTREHFFLGNMTGAGKEKRSGGTVDWLFMLCTLNVSKW